MPSKARNHAIIMQLPARMGPPWSRDDTGLLLEQLRYAGPVSVHEIRCEALDDKGNAMRYVFVTPANPRKLLTDVWAKQNRSRMASFGIHATIIVSSGDFGPWYMPDMDGKPDYSAPVRTDHN